MSIAVMSLVWSRAHVAAGDLLVLLALADWADDAGHAFPTMAMLAHKSRLSRRQVIRCVARLEEAGYVSVQRALGRGRTQFQVATEALAQEPLVKEPPEDSEPPEEQEPRGDNLSHQGRQFVTPAVTICHTSSDNLSSLRARDTDYPSYKPSYKPPDKPSEGAPAPARDLFDVDSATPEARSMTVPDSPMFLLIGASPSTRRGSLAPMGAMVTERGLEWARTAGWRADKAGLQLTVDTCVDHWKAKGEYAKDWQARIRTWVSGDIQRGVDLQYMRRQMPQGGQHGNGMGPASERYGYGAAGQPTNRATALLSTAQSLAEHQRARRLAGQSGGDAAPFSDADRGEQQP